MSVTCIAADRKVEEMKPLLISPLVPMILIILGSFICPEAAVAPVITPPQKVTAQEFALHRHPQAHTPNTHHDPRSQNDASGYYECLSLWAYS